MNNLNMSIKDESIVKVKVFTIAIYFDNNDHAYSSIILASTLTIAEVLIHILIYFDSYRVCTMSAAGGYNS